MRTHRFDYPYDCAYDTPKGQKKGIKGTGFAVAGNADVEHGPGSSALGCRMPGEQEMAGWRVEALGTLIFFSATEALDHETIG
jgi:hypothetical protein